MCRVTKDKRQAHLRLLTLKLTVIFGVTWALGFGLESRIIKYLFAILNSAQGMNDTCGKYLLVVVKPNSAFLTNVRSNAL